MFEKMKNWFMPKDIKPSPDAQAVMDHLGEKPKTKKLSPKEEATQKGEPYVSVVQVNVDPENINAGEFDLDYNDKFVVDLVKSGYKLRPDDTDADIVDRWFTTVCKNIALEVYEQEMADPDKRQAEQSDLLRNVTSKDLGDGYSEVQ